MTDQSADLRRGYRRAFIFGGIGCVGTLPAYEVVFALLKNVHFTLGGDIFPVMNIQPSYAYFILAALAMAVALLIGPMTKVLLVAKTVRTDTLSPLAQRLVGVTTTICALASLPPVAGFILALLTRQVVYLHLSVFLSLGLTLAYYPRFDRWEEWARILEEHGGTIRPTAG